MLWWGNEGLREALKQAFGIKEYEVLTALTITQEGIQATFARKENGT